ncbi:MAG TPA: hypothetical protein P5104_05355, partial [Bacteroidales bacterium]|nr:hypothetical protein [Bacteroidales bacterium]
MLSKVYKFKFVLALLLVPFVVSADPPLGWEKTETLFSHTLIIPETVVPEINGVPIVTGDWVGVFYNDAGTLKCGGSVEFNAEYANAFAAYGDDPLTLEKDGFGMSESFIWRVYKTADLENHWCEATLAATDPQTFMAFGTSTVESVVGPTFAVTASADPTLICGAGGDVTLSAFQLAGDPVETWEWYDNGTLIGTASQTTVFVDETTTFQVVATSGLLTTDAYVTVTVVYATAGSDEVYCDTQTEIELDGAYASGYVSLTWSGGTGSFNDPFALNPIYYPSAGDIANGAVTLSLNVITLDCGLFSDDIEITFQPSPVINIIPENAYVCYGQNFDFAGLVEATNYSLIQWGTTNGSGDFSNENILDPTYEPSSLDWLQGCIEIFVNASPIDPCTISDQDFFYLCFVSDPYADAGAAIPSICEGDITEYHFADAMVSFDPNYPGTFTFVSGNSFTTDITRVIEWTTTGSGTFDNPAAITPTYTF